MKVKTNLKAGQEEGAAADRAAPTAEKAAPTANAAVIMFVK
jgi:hypothetical protein